MERGRSFLLPSPLPLSSPPYLCSCSFPSSLPTLWGCSLDLFMWKNLCSWVGFLPSESVKSTLGEIQWALVLVQVKQRENMNERDVKQRKGTGPFRQWQSLILSSPDYWTYPSFPKVLDGIWANWVICPEALLCISAVFFTAIFWQKGDNETQVSFYLYMLILQKVAWHEGKGKQLKTKVLWKYWVLLKKQICMSGGRNRSANSLLLPIYSYSLTLDRILFQQLFWDYTQIYGLCSQFGHSNSLVTAESWIRISDNQKMPWSAARTWTFIFRYAEQEQSEISHDLWQHLYSFLF